jgi:hypothetical protein
MVHLVLGDVVGDKYLSVDVVGFPDVTVSRISCRIRTLECAVDVGLNSADTEDTADPLTPDHPVGVVERLLHLGDAQVADFEFLDSSLRHT